MNGSKNLVIRQCGRHEAIGEVAHRNDARAVGSSDFDFGIERKAHRGQLGCRVRMRQATAQGSTIARLPVSDMGQGRLEERNLVREGGGEFDLALTRHRTDPQDLSVEMQSRQTGDIAKINEMIRHGVTEIHHCHEGLAPGDNFCVVQSCKEGDSFIEAGRRMIFKWRGLHCRPSIRTARIGIETSHLQLLDAALFQPVLPDCDQV